MTAPLVLTSTPLPRVRLIQINRPKIRNCVNRRTATLLKEAFLAFDIDSSVDVAVLHGVGGHFCAGADLQAIASGNVEDRNDVSQLGPLGPTALTLTKPVIAAIEGCCVAGGIELACWCDLRVACRDSAFFGVFCRSVGVPLIDGGTVRLPRLIGQSRAADLLLTGREVRAEEAFSMGLVNRLVPQEKTGGKQQAGRVLESALLLAQQISVNPQRCLRNDRMSMLTQWDASSIKTALTAELQYGLQTLQSGEFVEGAKNFLKKKKVEKEGQQRQLPSSKL